MMKTFPKLIPGPNLTANQNLFCKCFFLLAMMMTVLQSCKEEAAVKSLRRIQMDPAQTKQMAAAIESLVKPELDSNLTLQLWGVDSLVVSPISIDIDDQGRIY